ncbi:thiamine-phosphate kinase [Marinobacterium sediminicola]|uniref:Thiamine-monophosphate kinase n=1 Tax=Marinobacterium sediminicola TaxID=518898 RepID=A0ABY1S275_9GAMM|nr:thiamine-phosphate kinase [Marinobacterium sediminicola]ULG69553.1 thiamine-phosphate kinase [Marinobacterium sediminicola]SMR75705.1 thiamine-monophosphate kinase [Marinobacterium sediminicola]
MGEFELIRRCFMQAKQGAGVITGIGDDCAVLQVPAGQQLVVSIDTLVEGTHFLPGTPPAEVAYRLLGAAVSDLAAAAATPAWLTLALTLPRGDAAWLEPFAAALAERATELGMSLVGGDTTRGATLTLSAQVHGLVPEGQALLRSGARAGDRILVSGTLGDSRGGLETLLHPLPVDADVRYLQQRFHRPEPRVSLAQRLRSRVHAGLDISDGLLADLNHMLEASGVGAEVQQQRVPCSAALRRLYPQHASEWALSGGEDFELCLSVAAEQVRGCVAAAERLGIRLTEVGCITAEPGLRVLDEFGQPVEGLAQGYDHFKESS